MGDSFGFWRECCSALLHPAKKVLAMEADFDVLEEIAFGSKSLVAEWTREGFLVSLK